MSTKSAREVEQAQSENKIPAPLLPQELAATGAPLYFIERGPGPGLTERLAPRRFERLATDPAAADSDVGRSKIGPGLTPDQTRPGPARNARPGTARPSEPARDRP